MPNKIHRRRSRKIQVALAFRVPNVNALAPHSQGIRLAERPPEHRSPKLLLSHDRVGHTRIMLVETRACQSHAELRFPLCTSVSTVVHAFDPPTVNTEDAEKPIALPDSV